MKKEIGIIESILIGKKCKDGSTRNLVFTAGTASKVKGVWIPKGGNVKSFDTATCKQMKSGDKIML